MDRLIIVSSQKQLESFYKCKFSEYIKIFNGFQNRTFPVISSVDALDVSFFEWGFFNPYTKKKYYTVDAKHLIHDKRFQFSIRNQKCLVPLNCYTIELEGKKFLIYNEEARIFSLAAIYTEYKDSENKRHIGFAILMVKAGNFFRSLGQTEEPLVIPGYAQRKWLDNKLHHATNLINSYKGIKYNGFPIGNGIEDKTADGKHLLQPIGPKIKEVTIKEEAFIIKKRTH